MARVRVLLPAACLVPFACAEPTDSASQRLIVEHTASHDDGQVYAIRGELGRVAAPLGDVATARAALDGVLPVIAAQFRVPAADLVATAVDRDRIGMTHVRLAQQKQGLRVVGGDLVLHLDRDGVVRSANGSVRDDAVPSVPAIFADAVVDIARRATPAPVEAGTPELVYLLANSDNALHLAWEVQVHGTSELLIDDVYVDALTGAFIERHPQVFTALNRSVFDGQGKTFPILFPPPPKVGSEASPPTGDQDAIAAFENTGKTYDCYKTLFQRDSWNGTGGKLDSTVHVVFATQSGGTSGNNAAWALNQMAYGDGDGMLLSHTARGFDVTAHELTHGVTSATAKLVYMNESGALNEGMSDIMGATCEAWRDGAVSAKTWLVGEDIFTPAKADDGLRYMANPTADAALYPPDIGGSRDFYADRYTGSQDNGGVHLNSGIPNLAFQLLTAGGMHPRGKTTFLVPAIGIEKSGAIFERALVNGYFTQNTNFAQARTATEQAAKDLFPETETAVGTAWAAVGIGQAPKPDTVPPTIQITSPAEGATVMPGFSVELMASDDVGVVKVELAIDGTTVDTKTNTGAVPSAPYAFTTAQAVAPGSHQVTATAYDSFNHTAASITVTIPMTCTESSQCGPDETCNAGVCEADTGGGGGCCDSRSNSGAGSLALFVVTGLALRRRRARR